MSDKNNCYAYSPGFLCHPKCDFLSSHMCDLFGVALTKTHIGSHMRCTGCLMKSDLASIVGLLVKNCDNRDFVLGDFIFLVDEKQKPKKNRKKQVS